MGKLQREWAFRRRLELIERLGGECWRCGSTTDLEIDHADGRDWKPRELDMSRRVSRYWREYRFGVRLQILCSECNARGKHEHFKPPLNYRPPAAPCPAQKTIPDENQPF